MMKTIITENGVTFGKLERNIYSWICEIGRQFTGELLKLYGRVLMEERDKNRHGQKGTWKNAIKSLWRGILPQGGL